MISALLSLAIASPAAVQAVQDAQPSGPTPLTPLAPTNVLVVVVDDLGVDMLAAYGVGSEVPITPNIDRLAASGLMFENAWSYNRCSPTRATIQTGRYGFRTGVGEIIWEWQQALPLSEFTIPEMLDAGNSGYAHALFGKWHLETAAVGAEDHPNLSGWGHYEGCPDNVPDFYNWPETVNGVTTQKTVYATTEEVDSTVAWIHSVPEPWVVILNLHAPHEPYHTPPPGTYVEDLTGLSPYGPGSTPRPFYKAAIESMDYELGRLVEGLGDTKKRLTMFLLGDNGTPGEDVIPPFRPARSKLTIYQGGVNVPFIVVGRHVANPGTRTDAMVSTADLFPTIAAIAGVDLATTVPAGVTIDGKDMLPVLKGTLPGASFRPTVFSEYFAPNGTSPTTTERTIRNDRYKLLRFDGVRDEFYDLSVDPFETNDLLMGTLTTEQQQNYDQLVLDLVALLSS
jgi:arylsulfatase A-like enzyme